MSADHTPADVRPGLRVRVHVNLHKGNLSVINPCVGRVIANVEDITLTGLTFRVQPGGLRRIREQRQRAAYAMGTVAAVNSNPDRVTFNPFTSDTFKCDGQPIHTAPEVVFRARAGWVPAAAEHPRAEVANTRSAPSGGYLRADHGPVGATERDPTPGALRDRIAD